MNRREKYITIYFYCFIMILVLLPVLGMSSSDGSGLGHSMEITGFYTEEEGMLPSSFSSLTENGDNLSIIAPFYYRLGIDGGLEKWDGVSTGQINNVISHAHKRNVKVLALVHNLLYGQPDLGIKLAQGVLQDSDSRELFVNQVSDLVTKAGFDGVMLDIEDISFNDRDKFSALVKQMKNNFARRDLIVAVAVPPETGDFVDGSWAVNFDYRAIGAWADRVIVMAYDEHGYSTGPGPIASRDWVERVIKYSMSAVSKDKIVLGVPVYGFDWEVDKPKPRYLSYNFAGSLAGSEGVAPVFNQSYGVPNFEYVSEGEQHQVWFEDLNSFKVKAEIVKKYELRGLAMWRLGMEDPAIWKYIGSEINVTKE